MISNLLNGRYKFFIRWDWIINIDQYLWIICFRAARKLVNILKINFVAEIHIINVINFFEIVCLDIIPKEINCISPQVTLWKFFIFLNMVCLIGVLKNQQLLQSEKDMTFFCRSKKKYGYTNKFFNKIYEIEIDIIAKYKFPFFYQIVKKKINNIIKELRPDIIHAHNIFSGKIASEFWERKRKILIICYLNISFFSYTTNKKDKYIHKKLRNPFTVLPITFYMSNIMFETHN